MFLMDGLGRLLKLHEIVIIDEPDELDEDDELEELDELLEEDITPPDELEELV